MRRLRKLLLFGCLAMTLGVEPTHAAAGRSWFGMSRWRPTSETTLVPPLFPTLSHWSVSWLRFLQGPSLSRELTLGGDALSSISGWVSARLNDDSVMVQPKCRFDYRVMQYFWSLELSLHL